MMIPSRVRSHLRKGRVVRAHIRYTIPRFGMIKAHAGPKTGYNEGHGSFIGEVQFVHYPGEPPGVYEISDAAVHDDFQRRGIGREMVRLAERQMLARTSNPVIAYLIPADEQAAVFWKRVGYHTADTPSGDYGMVKRLR